MGCNNFKAESHYCGINTVGKIFCYTNQLVNGLGVRREQGQLIRDGDVYFFSYQGYSVLNTNSMVSSGYFNFEHKLGAAGVVQDISLPLLSLPAIAIPYPSQDIGVFADDALAEPESIGFGSDCQVTVDILIKHLQKTGEFKRYRGFANYVRNNREYALF